MFARMLALALIVFVSTRTASANDPVSLLLEAPSAMKLVGEYIGLVESLDSKLDRLLDADLKTANALFEQAKTNPSKASDFIKDARLHFTRAAEVQSDSLDPARRNKRALALLGLWACCKAASDEPNAKATLEKIAKIPDTVTNAMVVDISAGRTARATGGLVWYTPFTPFMATTDVDKHRKNNKDFDSLLTIQEAVKKKLK